MRLAHITKLKMTAVAAAKLTDDGHFSAVQGNFASRRGGWDGNQHLKARYSLLLILTLTLLTLLGRQTDGAHEHRRPWSRLRLVHKKNYSREATCTM